MKLLQYERIIPANTSMNIFLNISGSILGLLHIIFKKKRKELCWTFFSLLKTGNGDKPFDLSGRFSHGQSLQRKHEEPRWKYQCMAAVV